LSEKKTSSETSFSVAFFVFFSGAALLVAFVVSIVVFVALPRAKERNAEHETAQPVGTAPNPEVAGPTHWTYTCNGLQTCILPTPATVEVGPPNVAPPGFYGDRDWLKCQAPGKRVCLMTIGPVDSALTDRIVGYYKDAYGLTILRGPDETLPIHFAKTIARPSEDSHEPQLDAESLSEYLSIMQRKAGTWNQSMEGLTLIVVTRSDLFLASNPQFRFVFGYRFGFQPDDETSALGGIISYYRMDDRNYGLRRNDAGLAARVEKMASKYIGLSYFELPLSGDPRSAMYDKVGSLADLDRMSDRLPLDPP
jgi:hypothetical protein